MPMSLTLMSRRIARRFSRNQRGVSAIEFALIAPIMALFYAGSVELASTLLADRKVTSAAATMGDLVARLPAANNCEIDNVFDATGLIFEPYSSAGVRLRISSIKPNAGTPTQMDVVWSYANGDWTALTPGDTVTLPAGIMSADGSILMAEIEYTYSPPFNRVFQTDPTLTDVFYMRPRATEELLFSTITCP
ncbi:MAG: TadE/TadG family type IV pilus assembly protein [Pseudomonadota bacterium]